MTKRNEKAILLWTIGIYLTPYLLRNKFFPEGIYPLNILSWIGIVLFIYNNYQGAGELTFRRIKPQRLFVGLTISFGLIFFLLIGDRTNLGVQDFIRIFIAVLAPIIIIGLTFKSYDGFERIYSRMLNIVNISAYFIVICALLDILNGYIISNFFANLYDIPSLFEMLSSGRIVSYFGHSLLTKEIFLIYYLLNYLKWSIISKKQNMMLPTIIAVIGIALTGSKTGIILIFLMIINSFFYHRMIKYIPFVIVICYLMYRFGIFNLVFDRLLYGLSIGDLSTGRNASLIDLINAGTLKFHWFYGNAAPITGDTLIAATEYPIIRWAYRYGMCFTILISVAIFLWPILRILKEKNIRAFFMVFIIIIDVNSYSTLPGTMDGMLIYCTTLFFTYNVLRYSQEVIY